MSNPENPDDNASRLLHRLADGRALRAVVPAPTGKLLVPIAADGDLGALIDGHLRGRLPPSPAACKDGRSWIEHRAVALAVCPIGSDGTASWFALDLDAGDHAGGSDSLADAAGGSAFRLLARTGLDALLTQSPGRRGRHCWCLLPGAIPGAAAHWLAELLGDEIRQRHPGAMVELRPCSPRPPGQPLTLPRPDRVLAEYRPADGGRHALDELMLRWHRAAEIEERRRLAREAQRQEWAKRAPSGRIESRDVDLESVAQYLADSVERRGGEVFARKSGIEGSIKIHPGKRMWAHFQSGRGGAGDAAAYELARFLLGDPPAREVFASLAAAKGVHHVG